MRSASPSSASPGWCRECYPFAEGTVIPYRAGETIAWRLAQTGQA